jgi:hypothetical protein
MSEEQGDLHEGSKNMSRDGTSDTNRDRTTRDGTVDGASRDGATDTTSDTCTTSDNGNDRTGNRSTGEFRGIGPELSNALLAHNILKERSSLDDVVLHFVEESTEG